jgi:glycosyltransferase involved in cell wall biosynthesis
VRELVVADETALVVAPERPEEIATAISDLLADHGRRERMGLAGRARAEITFDLESLADRHAHAYELALEHRARRRSGAQPRRARLR